MLVSFITEKNKTKKGHRTLWEGMMDMSVTLIVVMILPGFAYVWTHLPVPITCVPFFIFHYASIKLLETKLQGKPGNNWLPVSWESSWFCSIMEVTSSFNLSDRISITPSSCLLACHMSSLWTWIYGPSPVLRALVLLIPLPRHMSLMALLPSSDISFSVSHCFPFFVGPHKRGGQIHSPFYLSMLLFS